MDINFPDQNTPYARKADPSSGYLLQFCKAVGMYAQMNPMSWCRQSDTPPPGGRDTSTGIGWVGVNRAYAAGRQDPTNYMQKFAAIKGDQGEDQSYMNIDWSIAPHMPKIVNIIVARLMQRPRYVECRPLDPDALLDGALARARDVVKVRDREMLAKARGMWGLDVEDGSAPASMDEVDEIEESGGYRVALAESAELAITAMLEAANWERLLAKAAERDLVPVGRIAVQVCMGPDGIPYPDPVPPEELIMPWTQDDAWRGAPWKARCRYVDRPTFLRIATSHGVPFDRAEAIFKKAVSTWASTQQGLAEIVEVWVQETRPVNVKYRRTPGGDEAEVLPPGKDYKPAEGSSYHVAGKYAEVVLHAIWPKGTDELLVGGEMKGMPRTLAYPSDTWSMLHVVCPGIDGFSWTSTMDMLIPSADKLQMVELQIRNLLGRLGPDGIAVADYMTENIRDGADGSYTLEDAVRQFQQSGFLVYSGTDDNGDPRYNVPLPMTIKRGEVEKVLALTQIKAVLLQEANEIVGITPATAAAMTDPDTLNGALQVQMAGTETALAHLSRALDTLSVMVAKSLFAALQGALRSGTLSKAALEKFTSSNGILLRETAGMELASYDITMKAGMSVEDLADIRAKAEIQLNTRDAGKGPGITLADYWKVRLVKNPNTAIRILVKAVNKRLRENQEAEAMRSKAQSDMLAQQAEAVKAQQAEQHAMDMEKIQATAGVKGQQAAKDAEQAVRLESVRAANALEAGIVLQREKAGIDAEASRRDAMLEERMARLEALLEQATIEKQAQEDRKTAAAAPKTESKG